MTLTQKELKEAMQALIKKGFYHIWLKRNQSFFKHCCGPE